MTARCKSAVNQLDKDERKPKMKPELSAAGHRHAHTVQILTTCHRRYPTSRLPNYKLSTMKKRKRPKSKTPTKSRKLINEDSWREELENTLINDDAWWCIVTMMVEMIPEHSKCVSIFNDAAEEGKRKAIYSLSYQKMLYSVRMLSRQNLDKCPTVQGVCHYASKVLNEANGELPTWLTARIIKFLIYRAKEETIGVVKRLADLERDIDEEYRIMQTVVDWGQPGSKGFDAEKFNNKANTRLRKCNEDWRDAIYVDDAPSNGPNLFIILSGFHDPDLPEHLLSAGVPLSFILRIKRSNKEFERLAEYETIQRTPLQTKSLLHFESYESSGQDLFKFWETIETRVVEPETYPILCDVAFVTFRPPRLPKIYDEDEYERLKKNMYDRVSYFVYDLFDLYRQHSNYLKVMKVEERISDNSEERCDTQVYETLLDALPGECASVPMILVAMLLQIESNEKALMEEAVDERGDAGIVERTSEYQHDNTSPSPVSFVEQKIAALNAKFDLNEEHNANDTEQIVTDIELILGEDILNETIRLLDDSANFHVPSRSDLIDNILPAFWHPNITSLHSQHEVPAKKLEEYSRHIDKTRRYLDVETSHEEVGHYLHILMFDRMISGKSGSENGTSRATNETERRSMNLQRSLASMNRSKSAPSLTSKASLEIHFRSDGNIDYGNVPLKLVDCAPLFDLIDPRELLVPGYLKENVFDVRSKTEPNLEEFDDVELLTKSIFLQSLHECLLSYDSRRVLYFEPTDSVLLYFDDEWKVNGVNEVEGISSIRTPVRFRDFCEYVVAEEDDWIRREDQIYRLQTSESMGRLMKRAAEVSDETLLFRDEDFILPWSLKARDLDKSEGAIERRFDEDTQVSSSAGGTTERSKKGKREKRKAAKKGRQKEKKSVVDDGPTLTMERSTSPHDTEKETTYEFIGYDLGRLRVHVTNRRKTFFSEDGTLVRVEVDDWLYKNKDLRITVTLRGYSLRLFHRINDPENSKVFHLTSPMGIILAFQKLLEPEHATENPFKNSWPDWSLDFRASWPTGLLVEPIGGDSEENPFYIRQSYIRKKSNDEVCRKFLRNGTILKYLDDGKVVVLRPNGDIVTCIGFEKFQLNEDENFNKETNFAKGDRPSKGLKLSSKSKKKPARSSKSQLAGVVEQDPALALQDSTTVNQNYGNGVSMTDSAVKVSRYTVLNHDGRQYEVYDDLVVSEHHRLLVRTASDYEVDEKFTRRADGTDMLLNSNGELVVEFPDGTRITTGYTIEEEPAMCDWTEDEIRRYFAFDGTKGEEEGHDRGSPANFKFHEEGSSRLFAEYDDIVEILIADSFVSVLLTCRAEHKNYATVFYDQSAVSCTLSMPDDLRVSISRRGHYKVSMADGVNLKEQKLRPTNFDRRDLIRSTYSIPYDWLFPFGKNGDGIWESTHDLPLTTGIELTVPKLLNVRVLYGFKEPDGNAVIDIQRALGRYWMSLVGGAAEGCITANEKGEDTQVEIKTRHEYLEVDLHDLALGIKKTIDVATYRSGFEKQWKAPRAMQPRKSIEFDELLEQKASKREALEWYKRCFRERFILPYFQNIAGSCFLWVRDCVENASKISLANRLAAEPGESQKIHHFDDDCNAQERQDLD
ncbi:uncharacterized protein LOC128884608 [Hylaeus volcanicus]|uniref:uncharacterized protein LOC128884608 n=1 Tax=Hylaeus volcanicus TaxID=313075 RepID=UPI0023B80C3F|nr:uncharacterized protein LOC128884608 [Hylaeus volcanicus]